MPLEISVSLKLEFPDVAQALPLLSQLAAVFLRIEGKIDALTVAQAANHKESITFMSQVSVRLDALDAATNGIAAEFAKLRDSIKNSVTPEELARFDAANAALVAMGKDPEDPLPATP